jgi:hypothetical protein
MNIEALASMLSSKSGMQQSIASTIMSAVLSYVVQYFMQSGMMDSIIGKASPNRATNYSSQSAPSSSPSSFLQSSLSQLNSKVNDPTHPLVQEVKSKSGLTDNNQARQYTQQAIDVLQDNAGRDSQGFSSLIGSFLGSAGIGGEWAQEGQKRRKE